MKFLSFIVCSCLLIAGCGNRNKIPNDVLPPDKMEVVIWDMMRADQFLADYVLSKDTSKKKMEESVKLYQQIFSLHKITQEEFKKSFYYYQSHPLQLKGVMDSINTKKAAASTLPASADTSKTLADTIKKDIPQMVSPYSTSAIRDSMMKHQKKAMPIE